MRKRYTDISKLFVVFSPRENHVFMNLFYQCLALTQLLNPIEYLKNTSCYLCRDFLFLFTVGYDDRNNNRMICREGDRKLTLLVRINNNNNRR